MTHKHPDKLVLFGAGRIGRSFIGQLFSRGGYEVVFIDTFQPVIDELNLRGEYKVIIKGDHTEVMTITNVRGIIATDETLVASEIASADVVAVSVGLAGLPAVIPLIAKGLLIRYKTDPDHPLDLIIAENLRNAAEFFRVELARYLPPDYPLNQLVGLVETSIGKMVPLMQDKDIEEDILQVFAEPYNTLILDKAAFKNPIPAIPGLSPKENMKAWVDRKLFIHNLGHVATAYLGYLYNSGFVYLHEALAVPEIKAQVRSTMLQSADILLKKYPDEFSPTSLTEHADDLLRRFANRNLGDTIYRVGCDLFRKLGPEDRLAGAIRLAFEMDLPYDKILRALICGFYFRAADENGKLFPGDEEFIKIFSKGAAFVLTEVCGFDPGSSGDLYRAALEMDQEVAHLSV